MPALSFRQFIALTTAAAALAPAAAAHAAPGDTTLISRANGAAGAIADRTVFNPRISGDGSTVAFATEADNLSGFDDDDTIDVYTRTVGSHITGLVSAGPNPLPWLPNVGGDEDSSGQSISADGRFVAFTSESTNLTDDDEDAYQDVFVRDRLNGDVTLVSRDDGAIGDAADAESRRPSISADGRFVAFESDATNLSNADEDSSTDIFVRDRQLHQTALVSHRELDGGDDDSTHPTISPDGDTIAFYSEATNLSDNDLNAVKDVFAHNRETYGIELISRSTAGIPADAGPNSSAALALSANGNRIAFVSDASNLAPGDGSNVDIFVRDRAANSTNLATPGNGASFAPSLSADGLRLAFHSYATNLHPDDTGIMSDVYVHDLAMGAITLESRTSTGEQATGSANATITADGSTIAFSSTAVNLGAVMWSQGFVRQLPVPVGPDGGGAGPSGDGQGGGAPSGGGQNGGAPGVQPVPVAGTSPKPKVRRAGRLAFGRKASTCLRRQRLVLPLKLSGATAGVKITSSRVKIGTKRTLRYRSTAARKPTVRKLGRSPVTVRITAMTNIGKTVSLTKRFRVCRAK